MEENPENNRMYEKIVRANFIGLTDEDLFGPEFLLEEPELFIERKALPINTLPYFIHAPTSNRDKTPDKTPVKSEIHEKSPVIKNEDVEQKHENSYCKSCNIKIEDKRELRIHEKFRCRGNRCEACNMKIDNKKELKIHEKSIHGLEDVEHSSCKSCNIKIEDKRELRFHERFRCKENRCEACNIKIDNKKELKIHEKSIHGLIRNRDETPVKSEIHEKSPVIKNEDLEQKHENSFCKNCNIKIKDKRELKIHERFHCKENRCEACNIKIDNKKELKIHEKFIHGLFKIEMKLRLKVKPLKPNHIGIRKNQTQS